MGRCECVDSREIIAAVDRGGSYFFSADAMRFFRSRVAGTGWRVSDGAGETAGYVVVTSECPPGGVRAYTVRVFTFPDRGRIVERCDDAAGFMGYGTRAAAHGAARRAADRLAAAVVGGVADLVGDLDAYVSDLPGVPLSGMLAGVVPCQGCGWPVFDSDTGGVCDSCFAAAPVGVWFSFPADHVARVQARLGGC